MSKSLRSMSESERKAAIARRLESKTMGLGNQPSSPRINKNMDKVNPVRIQRKRTRGFVLKKCSPNELQIVCVSRPSKYGNHHRVGYCEICKEIHTQQQAVDKFESELTPEQIEKIRKDLENKNLACWCPLYDKNGLRFPCHADVLLRLANTNDKTSFLY